MQRKNLNHHSLNEKLSESFKISEYTGASCSRTFFGISASKSVFSENMKQVIILIFLIASGLSVPLRAGQTNPADSTQAGAKISGPQPYPSGLWIATQFVPSPELVSTDDAGLRFGLRWQVTPLLYSFAINRRLNPWRFFVAEPIVRQNGSLEWYLTPEWLNLTGRFETNWLFRSGLRVYIPIYRYGEYLSASFSASYYNFNGLQGVSYEAGIYIFFGILGLQATYSPGMTDAPWIVTLRLRYF